MLGYKAMAMAAKDPNLEVSWDARECWFTYEELKNDYLVEILDKDYWAVRKKKPQLPSKHNNILKFSDPSEPIECLNNRTHDLNDSINQIIDYLKDRE